MKLDKEIIMKQELNKSKTIRLELKKSELVNLSREDKVLPNELTPQVAGGWGTVVTVRVTVPTLLNCGGGGDDLMA
jgi:hypothetical protein